MNKVEKVSIGGYAFTLEEDAYAQLSLFLSEWEKYCSGQNDGQEIIESIEERIAEHILDNCGKDKVISMADILKVTATIGLPQSSGQSVNGSDSDVSALLQTPEQKRFMRDPEHRIIGGVCSGLSAYLKVDVVLIRVAWVLIFLLSASAAKRWDSFSGVTAFVFLMYIILWIVSPAPKTVKEQRLVHEAASAAPSSDFWPVMGRIFRIFFGCLFAMIGITLLVSAIAFGIFGKDIPGLWTWVERGDASGILFALTLFLPAVGFLWEGVSMLFNLKPLKWHPGLVCFLLWFASIIVFGIVFSAEFFT